MRKQSIASKCVTDHMNEYNKLQMICISIIIYKSQMVNVEADKNLDLVDRAGVEIWQLEVSKRVAPGKYLIVLAGG